MDAECFFISNPSKEYIPTLSPSPFSHDPACAAISCVVHGIRIKSLRCRDPDVLTCWCIVTKKSSTPYVRKPGSPERRQGDPHDKRGHSKGRALSPKVSPLSSIPALFESSLTLRLKLTEEGSSNISFLFLTPIPTSMPDLSTQLEPHPSLSISRAHVFSHDAKCHAPHH